MKRIVALLVLIYVCAPAMGGDAKPFDAAAAFGARESVFGMRLSPDGKSVAYVAPIEGQGSALYTFSLAEGAKARPALAVNGKPDRLEGCSWVANDRLACYLFGVAKNPTYGILPYSRIMAVNTDTTNLRMLSRRDSEYRRACSFTGAASSTHCRPRMAPFS